MQLVGYIRSKELKKPQRDWEEEGSRGKGAPPGAVQQASAQPFPRLRSLRGCSPLLVAAQSSSLGWLFLAHTESLEPQRSWEFRPSLA